MVFNKKCFSTVPHKNKTIILKPMSNMKGKLLAPLVFSNYINKQMKEINHILSRFDDSNFVKVWLLNNLEKDEIIINAEIEVNDSNKIILKFNETALELSTKIFEDNNFNNLSAGCYVIDFTNQYYIGSTSDFKNRFKSHSKHINEFIKGVDINFLYKYNELNEVMRFYLSNPKNIREFEFKILYLNTNYLNKFKSIYPDYKLNRDEIFILSRVTDFIIKLLEQSLINKIRPFLNMSNIVIFKRFGWKDSYTRKIKNKK